MGHPEGFIEAFANLYRELALAIDARRRLGEALQAPRLDFPGVRDGVRGMRFLEAVVESSRAGAWVAVAGDAVPAALGKDFAGPAPLPGERPCLAERA
jgi:predicted dehydrogenase